MKRREMGEARQWENRYKGDFSEKIVKWASSITGNTFNSHGKHQKTYLSFGTDLAHVVDVTECLIIGNEYRPECST